ncbi:hypothetical protein ACFL58_01825 [Elusimicrobiota bacterium]
MNKPLKVFTLFFVFAFIAVSFSSCSELTNWMIGRKQKDNKKTVVYRGQPETGVEVHRVDTPEIKDPNTQDVRCYTTEYDEDGTLRLLPWDNDTVFSQSNLATGAMYSSHEAMVHAGYVEFRSYDPSGSPETPALHDSGHNIDYWYRIYIETYDSSSNNSIQQTEYNSLIYGEQQ